MALLLAHIVAALNTLAAILLIIGRIQIARGNRYAHQFVMTSAVATSALFLAVYIAHHILSPLNPFHGEGWIRPVYFALLGTHILLAVAVTPLVIMTFLRARAGQFERHKQLARWVWPIWLYVSVTGIIVYLMLYQIYTGAA